MLIEVFELLMLVVYDRHLRAEPEGREHGVKPYRSAAYHGNPAVPYPRSAAQKDPLPSLRLLEEMDSHLDRQPACYLAHGDEKRERAVGELDGLEGYGAASALLEGLNELIVGREMEIAKNRVMFFY